MGGSAFSNKGIQTPRMDPKTYYALKTKYHNILLTLYEHVTTPPEAPEKTSHGDLDYLVAGPRVHGGVEVRMGDVKVAFGAEYMTAISGATTSFAVLLPEEESQGGEEKGEGEEEGKPYAQIDVHVCPSAENMHWVSFKHAYGDFWSILGMMCRAKGLVADEKCLNLRVREIQDHNRELAKIELTRSVSETLEFCGLDAGKYEKGFECVKEVYEYLAESRFFEEGYFKEKKFANASDRSKVGKRDMMRGWFTFLGVDIALIGKIEGGQKGDDGDTKLEEKSTKEEEEIRESGARTPEWGLTREQVLEEALERFDKRPAYEEKLAAWRKDLTIATVLRGFKKTLIDGGHSGERSARKKASVLRKRIEEGEMDEVFDMTEEQIKAFIEARVNELVQNNANNTSADAVGGVAAVRP
ncbi:hypothetical protein TWF481_008365 [Arthrobotrys musiformis]|uniref:Uncharacterized protein n=1 Tax=Arthrobotrys musiformis TaxID=47236 RepID=A0AAV9W8R3_9PEZI